MEIYPCQPLKSLPSADRPLAAVYTILQISIRICTFMQLKVRKIFLSEFGLVLLFFESNLLTIEAIAMCGTSNYLNYVSRLPRTWVDCYLYDG